MTVRYLIVAAAVVRLLLGSSMIINQQSGNLAPMTGIHSIGADRLSTSASSVHPMMEQFDLHAFEIYQVCPVPNHFGADILSAFIFRQ
jgi:hypothetical protein